LELRKRSLTKMSWSGPIANPISRKKGGAKLSHLAGASDNEGTAKSGGQ